MKESVLAEQSLSFAVEILALADALREKKEFILSDQICKSGTSIGANIREAQYAISRADFIAKMFIALKEANETEYWLELLMRSGKINRSDYEKFLSACKGMRAMLIALIKTAKAGEKVKE